MVLLDYLQSWTNRELLPKIFLLIVVCLLVVIFQGSNEVPVETLELLKQPDIDKLTLVLVTTCWEKEKCRLRMLAATLRYFEHGSVSKMFIVTSDTCIEDPEAFLTFSPDLGFPIEVISETKLLSVSCNDGGKDMMPYAKQMLLKLQVSFRIKTRFYLTLDSDILVIKDPIGLQDLIPDNRAIWYPNGWSQHSDWWEASFRILGDNRCKEEFKSDKYWLTGVTPYILATDIARRTFTKISVRWPKGVVCRALEYWAENSTLGPWTEYTAFRIVACQEGLWEKYYQKKDYQKKTDAHLYHWSEANESCQSIYCQRQQLREELLLAKKWRRLMFIAQDDSYPHPEWLVPVIKDVLNITITKS